jgi:hypothetical protein
LLIRLLIHQEPLQRNDVNGHNDLLSKLVCQANKPSNAEVTKADDANKANNDNAHANKAIGAKVAKDSAAGVANKRPHPPL